LGANGGGPAENVKNGNGILASPPLRSGNTRPTTHRLTSDSMTRRKGVDNNKDETDDHDESRDDGNTSASASKGEDGGDEVVAVGGSSSATGQHSSPKKRRKVNHGMFYDFLFFQ
jgi:hypothetical protein